MDVKNVSELITTVGFPIFVAVWLLYKSHKDTETVKDSVNRLENAIIELTTYIRAMAKKGGDDGGL